MKITKAVFTNGSENLKRSWFHVLLVSLLAPVILSSASTHAQSRAEFEQWKKQYLGEFQQYKDQMDKEFASFLQQRWKPFDTESGLVRDKAPKPVRIPVAKPPVAEKKPTLKIPEPVVREPVVQVVRIPSPVPPQPVTIIPPPQPEENIVTVDFLGYHLPVVDGISRSTGAVPLTVSQQGIQQRFARLAQSEYPATVKQLLKIKQRLKLNDWAYMRLIQRFSSEIAHDQNNQNVLSWFLMLKSGLDARVAYDSTRVFLLVPTQQELYDIAFFIFDGKKYYDVSGQKNLPKNLYSYDGRYPKPLSLADVALKRSLQSKQEEQVKKLKFRFNKKDYRLNVPYNRNTVRFLGEYPQMDLEQYFRTPVDSRTADALLRQLAAIIEGMPQTEAVNLLLRFVQKSFRYETDQDQFGAENYMFVEETIFYPASDCEDRAIMFAWLVRELLGLDVVALDFPGHVATAVALQKPVGSVISFEGKRYTIADPTYINANVGMKMPQYRNTTPRVISIL